jgi:hypothetical protein
MQMKASSLGLGVSFLSSLWVEGWLWIGWVMGFGWFECCFLFVVGGARNKLGSTLLTLILTPLKANTQSILNTLIINKLLKFSKLSLLCSKL